VQILQAGSGGITTTYWYGVGAIGEFGSQTSYYLVDSNGSVRQAVDQNASVTFARWYDPFGQIIAQNGTGDEPELTNQTGPTPSEPAPFHSSSRSIPVGLKRA